MPNRAHLARAPTVGEATGRITRCVRLLLLVGLASLAVSCLWGDAPYEVPLGPRATATEHRAGASTEATEAATAMCYLAAVDRAELVARLTQEVAEIQAGINRLAAEAEVVRRAAAKELLGATLETMRRRWALSSVRLEKAEQTARPSRNDLKSGPPNPEPRCGTGSKTRACG